MPRTIDEKKQMYLDVFAGETAYIPLIVKVGPQIDLEAGYSSWEGIHDPAKAIDTFITQNSLSMQVESDWIPVIESDFLYCLVPGIFGAEVFEIFNGGTGFKPYIDDLRRMQDFEPDVFGAEYQQVSEHIKYLRENVPDGIVVKSPRFFSPLDLGVMMRGGPFYEDLLAEPELSVKFMEQLNEVTIQLVKALKVIADEDRDSQVTLRGVNFPGVRLSGDSVVNLSPKMIRDYMFGIYQRFANAVGPVMLHYCTAGSENPAPVGHVITTLLDCPAVACIDNWHGYKSAFDKNGTNLLQDKISICTDLSPEDVDNVAELMTEPFFAQVRRKGGRAVTASVLADSVDQGKRLYDKWTNYFTKNNMK